MPKSEKQRAKRRPRSFFKCPKCSKQANTRSGRKVKGVFMRVRRCPDCGLFRTTQKNQKSPETLLDWKLVYDEEYRLKKASLAEDNQAIEIPKEWQSHKPERPVDATHYKTREGGGLGSAYEYYKQGERFGKRCDYVHRFGEWVRVSGGKMSRGARVIPKIKSIKGVENGKKT